MLKQNAYIVSLEAKDLINAQKYKRGFETKGKENWIYKGALDYSLEALKIEELNKKAFFIKNKKQYTNEVVNVTFKYAISGIKFYYKEKRDRLKKTLKNRPRKKINIIRYNNFNKLNTRELREKLYKEGFIMDGKRYVRFKRSGGASRVGKCLFINEKLYKKIMKWSYMGLEYKENEKMDLASMEAYISLTTSSIIDIIKINPKNILLIDDYESKFNDVLMATEWDDVKQELLTRKREVEVSNSIWDGQSLLDKSVFDDNGYSDKGFILTRNRFFKSACFNCDIQKFFKDNNITDVSQLNGLTHAEKIEDIKMITTPSSIKFLKMAKEHKKFKVKGKYDKYKAFEYWCENVEDSFGVVKYEKPPHNLHEMVSTHYQLINTLPLTKDDVKALLGQTLDYIGLIKNDVSVFKYHLGITLDNDNETGYLDDNIVNNFDFTDSNKLIYDLLKINDDFVKTKAIKKFRANMIEAYKNNLRKGHILVNGNYSVLCGNGYEMLLSSIGMFDGQSNLGTDEAYNLSMEFDKEVIGIRSPHVTMGNIWVFTNKYNKYLNDYFNDSKYIIHVNSINNNLLERLSGADFDSDQILISDNKILVDSAKKIYGKFLVPTDFTPKKAVSRHNTIDDKIDLDIKTSKNLIGEIINMSQILNSEYWDRVSKGQDVTGLYELISQLDVMSCIEIDKAKKESIVNATKELKKIRESQWMQKGIISRNKVKRVVMCRPLFFKYVGEGKDYKFVKKETPMDYLQMVIDENIPRVSKSESDLNFLDLFVNKTTKKANHTKVNRILDKVIKFNNEITSLFAKEINVEDRTRYRNIKKERIISEIKKMKVDELILLTILKRLNNEGKDKYSNLRKSYLTILNIIYNAHKECFLKLLKGDEGKASFIKEDKNGEIKIYDKNFTKQFLKNA